MKLNSLFETLYQLARNECQKVVVKVKKGKVASVLNEVPDHKRHPLLN
jgi:hypothetical protein